ncbi:LrgB family protein [Xanthobacter dioxanivorans]|uniref:LrgB family protein n=1 Tax=Xanthobacter dioxanivorans TaxID=2528964 RepID=A0A974PL13_9HYPH|nr:LrgB family protein [Xanthobacter dioxanivorans]QRG05522.1 LrgB family protein [Xanthobacter dioxanivorans]
MLHDPLFAALFWSAVTIGGYAAARLVARRWRFWWTSPLLLTPVAVGAVALSLHTGYADYIRGTHWLVLMMGPATVAFALPIYEQRALIRRHWPVLLVGVLVGSTLAMTTAFILADLFGLSQTLQLSLMPRSTSTPFAMAVSGDIGGAPDLTAVFVIVTGICGAALGELVMKLMPLRSSLARGALFGMGAHGAGVARAHQIGGEEGSIAGLVMVLAGLFNVLMAPAVAHLLH